MGASERHGTLEYQLYIAGSLVVMDATLIPVFVLRRTTATSSKVEASSMEMEQATAPPITATTTTSTTIAKYGGY